MAIDLDGLFPHSEEIIRRTVRSFEDALIDIWASSGDAAKPREAAEVGLDVPAGPRELADVVSELRRHMLPACLNTTHPGCVAHMDTLPTLAAAVCESITASLNNNMLFAELSPAFTTMERELLRWFAARFRLPDGAGGTMTSGGSLANLLAVLLARHRFDPAVRESGWTHGDRAVVLASDAVHASIPKAVMALGMGRQALVKVRSDAEGRLSIDALAEALRKLPREGRRGFMVVAVAGTTVTGATDDLSAIGRLCREHGVWFHVDAAYGGAVVFSAKHRPLLTGIELADSITFNPQKWMYVPKAAAMLLVRRPELLAEAVGVRMPYSNGSPFNFGDLSLQGTRPVDVLKVWLNLQLLGLSGIESLIDHTMSLGRHFAERVERSVEFELVSRGDLNICCFQPRDPAADPQAVRKRFLDRQGCLLSLPTFRGRRLLRAVLLNPRLTFEHIDRWLAG